MKTKQQIQLAILSLKDKIEVNKTKQTGLWGTLVNMEARLRMNNTITILEWVISDINEPLTINIDGQQTNTHNALNP